MAYPWLCRQSKTTLLMQNTNCISGAFLCVDFTGLCSLPIALIQTHIFCKSQLVCMQVIQQR